MTFVRKIRTFNIDEIGESDGHKMLVKLTKGKTDQLLLELF